MRGTVLAQRLARAVGLEDTACRDLYWLTLLRHVGCNAESHSFGAMVGDEVEFNRRIMAADAGRGSEVVPILIDVIRKSNADAGAGTVAAAILRALFASKALAAEVIGSHCDTAKRLAARLGFGDRLIEALGKSEERWNGSGLPARLKGVAIPPIVRIANIAIDYVALCNVWPRARAVEIIRERMGRTYDPDSAKVFLARHDELVAGLDGLQGWEAVLALEPEPVSLFEPGEFEQACLVIADFADLKSPTLAGHSRAVADLSASAAGRLGLPASDVETVRLAGLLHDVGYAAIPARARLSASHSETERERLRLHPYFGERILSRAPSLARVGAIVAAHHERLDGSGYYRGLRQSDIGLPARLLGAAEAYQAMLEGRGGEPPRTAENAAALLRAEIRTGRLDAAAGEAVLAAAGQPSRRQAATAVDGLTAREVEVLRLLGRGSSAKDVARALGIAPKTARNHVQNLYAKIGVATRAGATLYAVEKGIVVAGSAA